MRMPWSRPTTPALGSVSLELETREKVLATATADDGSVLAGTRDAFLMQAPDEPLVRWPWEQVQAADWDAETAVFRISEVGHWGQARRELTATLVDRGSLLALVNERVTASIVLQQHVPVQGSRGLRVIARRAPHGGGDLLWLYEFDEGVEPEDPEIRRLAEEALARAKSDVGVG